jgi:hypothetical protein
MWYGGQAAVPSCLIFSTRNFSNWGGASSAFVSCQNIVLLAEPPPLARNRNRYSAPSVA